MHCCPANIINRTVRGTKFSERDGPSCENRIYLFVLEEVELSSRETVTCDNSEKMNHVQRFDIIRIKYSRCTVCFKFARYKMRIAVDSATM